LLTFIRTMFQFIRTMFRDMSVESFMQRKLVYFHFYIFLFISLYVSRFVLGNILFINTCDNTNYTMVCKK